MSVYINGNRYPSIYLQCKEIGEIFEVNRVFSCSLNLLVFINFTIPVRSDGC